MLWGRVLRFSLGKSKGDYIGNDIGEAGEREWHYAMELGCSAWQVGY